VIATKFGWGTGMADGIARGSAVAIREDVQASLRRLETDRIDLYYYHRPDEITPIAETLGVLTELVEEGLVCFVGCSNVGEGQLSEADEAAATGRLARGDDETAVDRAAAPGWRPGPRCDV
jgi:aryl-alcohol dehydrogenase-like predicted oxidoreductase